MKNPHLKCASQQRYSMCENGHEIKKILQDFLIISLRNLSVVTFRSLTPVGGRGLKHLHSHVHSVNAT